jgi:hypothetical protein
VTTDVTGVQVTPSLITLVLANLWPLAGVVFFRWTVFPVLVLFWLENPIVGSCNAGRMWLAADANGGSPDQPTAALAPLIVPRIGIDAIAHLRQPQSPRGTDAAATEPGMPGRRESGRVPGRR